MTTHTPEPRWRTKITDASAEGVRIRGYDLSELSRSVDFASTFYLLTVGELPTEAQGKALNALMISACDRGITPSSAISRTVASCGAPLQAAVAAGILTFGDVQGGVGIEMGRGLLRATAGLEGSVTHDSSEARAAAEAFVDHYEALGQRIPGYGQPLHPDGDPRARRLIEYAFDLGVDGTALAVGLAAEVVIAERKGRPIPMNVDGAIACVAIDIGMPPDIIRAINFVARAAGLSAHVLEEMETSTSFRLLATDDEVAYEGTGPRSIDGQG
ncbi:citryl-CoA lyase [Nocardioides hwasunensis]|uniref:citrate synthase (unknown stereospecificity) n=1 Tax=Nocardioides hwasunensis TaxID=397258 RepID=A0ABR8MG51_9ACTN|nr:citryl-CoA lyase [Nocardioides hwasunensis]MBD3915058.1 citryl-CoA lyase [Nocardioides hwasunensis]